GGRAPGPAHAGRSRRWRGPPRRRARRSRETRASAVAPERGGHVARGATREQEHLVDAREVHRRRDLRVAEQRRAAVVDGAHAAARDPTREEPAEDRKSTRLTPV